MSNDEFLFRFRNCLRELAELNQAFIEIDNLVYDVDMTDELGALQLIYQDLEERLVKDGT